MAARAATLVATLLLPALLLPAQGQTSLSTEYAITIQEARAGTMSVARQGGQVRVVYSYRDNGRGPDIEETYTVGAGERVLVYQGQGKAEFGADIGERFELAEGRVRWSSPADRGDESAADGELYVPLQATPAYVGQLATALLARAEGTAPVGPATPGAKLAAELVARLEGLPGLGSSRALLVAITGADAFPWFVWLREGSDGAAPTFLGLVWPGWAVLPTGLEGLADGLLKRQREAQNERLAALGRGAATPLPGLTLVANARWFDAPAARLRGPSDIYLFDGRIAAITRPGQLQAAPQQVVRADGLTLLPGLIDMHAHLWGGEAPMHLAAGVTTVRDMAAKNDDLLELKRRIDAGEVPGPHVVPAGFIEGKSPFSSRSGFVVDSVEAGLAAVDWYAARGYHQIKLYNSIKPEWVKPLAARAHAHGMTVAGHVPAFMRAEQAVRAGFDELTHINQVMLNFLVKPEHDTRTLLRFTLVADEAARIRAPEAARFIALLRARRTAVDPTLATFEGQFTQRDGEPNPSFVAVAAHLPVLWKRGLLQSDSSPDAVQVKRWRASFARMSQFVAQMHRAGVPLVAGTDGTAGLMMWRELELYVQAGISAPEALRIATWNGARVAGVAERTGSIARGKAADLVLVHGDPTRDITALRRTALVIKGAVAYSPAALWEAMGMRPFAPAAAVERSRATQP